MKIFLAKVKYTFISFHLDFIHPWFKRKFHGVRHENIFELENYFLWLKVCFTIRLLRHRLHLDCCWYLGMGNLNFLEPDHLLQSEYHGLNCKTNRLTDVLFVSLSCRSQNVESLLSFRFISNETFKFIQFKLPVAIWMRNKTWCGSYQLVVRWWQQKYACFSVCL